MAHSLKLMVYGIEPIRLNSFSFNKRVAQGGEKDLENLEPCFLQVFFM
jgi:hypothetical protein